MTDDASEREGPVSDAVIAQLFNRARDGREEMLRSMELMRTMQATSTRDALQLMAQARATLDDARATDTTGSLPGLVSRTTDVDARADALERSVSDVAHRLEDAQHAVEAAVARASLLIQANLPGAGHRDT